MIFFSQRGFDSILVRIKRPDIERTAHVVRTRFRFHTGSIKRQQATTVEQMSTMFRFHTGSIKRKPQTQLNISTVTFRFHTGSIKSRIL